MLEHLLVKSRYDEGKTAKLIDGFTNGFRIGYQGNRKIRQTSQNLCLSVGSPTVLWNRVMEEVEKGRYAGPFLQPPYDYFIQSPIGLVPKDHGHDVSLLFHLSYPRSGNLVNSQTPKELSTVKYPDFCEAVQLCMELTKNSKNKLVYQGKSDMKSAFRNLPLLVSDYMLLLIKATNPLDGTTCWFLDKCLPFGASISCSLFQEFSNCVAYLFTYCTGKKTVNYLDDYYFIALLKSLCDGQIKAFLEICDLINFPVSLNKTEWGTQIIVFLGFLIDSTKQLICIPMEKVSRAVVMICDFLNRRNKKVTVHQLQKLCGFLNHLCKCIITGRYYQKDLPYNLDSFQ